MYGYSHFGMGLGGLGMILVWIVPLVVLVLLFLKFSSDRKKHPGKTALEILDEHYAHGEFDRDEYLKRRADLGG